MSTQENADDSQANQSRATPFYHAGHAVRPLARGLEPRFQVFSAGGQLLAAVDAGTGARLWQFQASVHWKASPMTYVFDGRQHIAVAAGPSVVSFALVE